MKKYMTNIEKMNSTDLNKKAVDLRVEISDLKRGLKTGDVQNTQAVRLRKKELARVLTLIAKPKIEEPVKVEKVKKAAKTATKEKK